MSWWKRQIQMTLIDDLDLTPQKGDFRIVPNYIGGFYVEECIPSTSRGLIWTDSVYYATEFEAEREIQKHLEWRKEAREHEDKKAQWIKDNPPRKVPPFKFLSR